MHFNQLKQKHQQQEQHQQQQQPPQQNTHQISDVDFTKNSDRTISLASNGCDHEIKTLLQATDTEKFGGSSTSSTDSGVNISDNETTSPPSPLPNSQQLSKQMPTAISSSNAASTTSTAITYTPYRKQSQQNYNNNNSPSFAPSDNTKNTNNKNIGQSWNIAGADAEGRRGGTNTFDNESRSGEQLRINSSNDNSCGGALSPSNPNAIKIENVINSNAPASTNGTEASDVTADKGARAIGKATLFSVPPRVPSPSTSSVVSSSDSDVSENPPFHNHHYHHNGSPVVSMRSIDSSVIDSSDSDSDENGNLEGEHKNYVIKKLGTQVTYPPKHPDIPVINDGLKVVDQKITPNGMGPSPASPLDIIKNMCDNVAVLHPHRQVAASSSIRPQVAISSSTDVTIGDKHFYEGPVTIQQFLIDSRNKWNESNGNDNVVFVDDNGDSRKNAKDINEPSAPADSDGRCVSILKRKKYLIAGACAMITLIVLAIVFGIEVSAENKSKLVPGNSEESRKNIPINSTIDTTSGVFGGTYEDDGCVEGQLCLVDRGTWRAHPQKNKLDPQTLPLQRVVIAHTASEPCNSLATCSERVRVIQEYHMNSFEWDDIGYNFLVSSDGRIYVGRGWDDVGAVVKGFNTNSVGIAFIGTYVKTKPTEAQLKACLLLLEEGVRLKKLKPDYILNGARQLSATESPGDALYRIIQTWPHWTSKIYL
ncbi:peptidoglycan-recognition protein LC isoform X1 [Musca domestica]|uniref:Peptidoglycan-recognition protein LC isoform X1 n=1 Tax=Musca domestica TaxID=7370 RepID=A0ABM3VPV7_MUSDO|nr:peptidoglycan-recognition protein LC isoform X1 [Musca domestica]XP_058987837.1 peptidoglycan-recognition protein LC isoform X1 [Musca domestica]XP_058987838.1 peptidoglycan-recognition protein LC isoform X1 [Musca domestica]